MFRIIAITDRTLCADLKERLLTLAQNNIPFILREKDMGDDEYCNLCEYAKSLTDNFMIHTRIQLAKEKGHRKVHLTFNDFYNSDISELDVVGVSVHSVEEAMYCENNGADYVIYSHIFPTDCKKDLPPKGVGKLKKVCDALKIPVYALGGINHNNISEVRETGAKGACVMSLLMKCEDIKAEFQKLAGSALT